MACSRAALARFQRAGGLRADRLRAGALAVACVPARWVDGILRAAAPAPTRMGQALARLQEVMDVLDHVLARAERRTAA